MKTYLVTYTQRDPANMEDEIISYFRFQADDMQHAIEQAEDHLKEESWEFEIISVGKE